ncbi:hypothetical protein TNCV_504101 [Trichonephila clavipes]|nr:hypothetical protein TNCV_504101 [Trichonephila clavipes]
MSSREGSRFQFQLLETFDTAAFENPTGPFYVKSVKTQRLLVAVVKTRQWCLLSGVVPVVSSSAEIQNYQVRRHSPWSAWA